MTSESVTEGHPDKICDRISDGVLDAILAQDKNARVACETCATTGMVLIMGEITTTANVDIPAIARDVIKETGYDNSDYGFDYKTCAILTTLDKQSPDIAMGVDNALEGRDKNEFDTGAGDQGMMFGYACDETEELMPLTISLAHALSKKLTAVRKSGEIPYLLPDGKTQVTVEYNEDGTPSRIDTVVVSSQHKAEATQAQLRADIIEKVIKTTVPASLLDENTKMLINPTGRFVVGGPQGDSGLTGRKIIVNTYGGVGGKRSHKGRPFSRLCRKTRCKEHCSRRYSKALRGRACIRYRRCTARIDICRYIRHRHKARYRDLSRSKQGVRPSPQRNNQLPELKKHQVQTPCRLRSYGTYRP